MSFNYNQTTLVGRLTHDPESFTFGEKTKTNFSVAVSRPYKKQDGTIPVDFINVVAWGKLAELCVKYLRKGCPVLIDGKIQIRTFEKEEKKHYRTEVVAENFQILKKLENPVKAAA